MTTLDANTTVALTIIGALSVRTLNVCSPSPTPFTLSPDGRCGDTLTCPSQSTLRLGLIPDINFTRMELITILVLHTRSHVYEYIDTNTHGHAPPDSILVKYIHINTHKYIDLPLLHNNIDLRFHHHHLYLLRCNEPGMALGPGGTTAIAEPLKNLKKLTTLDLGGKFPNQYRSQSNYLHYPRLQHSPPPSC